MREILVEIALGSAAVVVPAVVPVVTAVPASVVVPVSLVVVVETVVLDAFLPDAIALSDLPPDASFAPADFGVEAFGDPVTFGAPAVFGAFEPALATCVFTFGALAPCADAESAATTTANASATSIVTG